MTPPFTFRDSTLTLCITTALEPIKTFTALSDASPIPQLKLRHPPGSTPVLNRQRASKSVDAGEGGRGTDGGDSDDDEDGSDDDDLMDDELEEVGASFLCV